MTSRLSAIAIGAILACASHVAASQTITVAQQGNGNTASAEQVTPAPVPIFDPSATTASITQIGNNNHVGGPGATSGGIFQNVFPYGAIAVVSQTGTGNNAGITQDGRPGPNPPPVQARITQRGNGNDAAITQTDAVSNYINVDQNGSGNLARLRQVGSGDASLRITQNGTGNTASVDHLNSSHGGPEVSQTGDRNTVSIFADNVLGPGASITQDGSMNNASVLIDTDSMLTLSQQGVGNVVNASESGAGYADISQKGNYNLASVTQADGLHRASIAQIGNSNSATVTQVRQADYVANVNQTGSGNSSNVYQH